MSRNGMQIKSPLGEEAYVNPLNGKFTSSEYEAAIKFAEEMPLAGLMKTNIYRYGSRRRYDYIRNTKFVTNRF